jgi:hypothetical protein
MLEAQSTRMYCRCKKKRETGSPKLKQARPAASSQAPQSKSHRKVISALPARIPIDLEAGFA